MSEVITTWAQEINGELILERCPFCSRQHIHGLREGLRASLCGRGEYDVRVRPGSSPESVQARFDLACHELMIISHSEVGDAVYRLRQLSRLLSRLADDTECWLHEEDIGDDDEDGVIGGYFEESTQ